MAEELIVSSTEDMGGDNMQPPKKQEIVLTDDEKKILVKEIQNYAKDGASDDDLRQFKDVFSKKIVEKRGGIQKKNEVLPTTAKPLQDGSTLLPQNNQVPQEATFDAKTIREQKLRLAQPIKKIGQQSYGAMGVGGVTEGYEDPIDARERKAAQEAMNVSLDAGAKKYGVSKKELERVVDNFDNVEDENIIAKQLEVLKQNPARYERVEAANNIDKTIRKNIVGTLPPQEVENVFAKMNWLRGGDTKDENGNIVKRETRNYTQTRADSREFSKLIDQYTTGEENRKLHEQLIKEYGVNYSGIVGQKEALQNDPNRGTLSDYELMGYHILEDLDPEMAQTYGGAKFNVKMPTMPKDSDMSITGGTAWDEYERQNLGNQHQKAKLAQIGINAAKLHAEEEMSKLLANRPTSTVSKEEHDAVQPKFDELKELSDRIKNYNNTFDNAAENSNTKSGEYANLEISNSFIDQKLDKLLSGDKMLAQSNREQIKELMEIRAENASKMLDLGTNIPKAAIEHYKATVKRYNELLNETQPIRERLQKEQLTDEERSRYDYADALLKQADKAEKELTNPNGRYGKIADYNVDGIAQELVGQANNLGENQLAKASSSLKSPINSLSDMSNEVLNNQEQSRRHAASVVGRSLLDEKSKYTTQKNSLFNSFDIHGDEKFSKEIEVINNDKSLSQEEKIVKAKALLLSNNKWFVQPKETTLNNSLRAWMYGISDTANMLATFMLKQAATGGLGNVSKARELSSMATVMFADEMQARVEQNIINNVPNPVGKAFLPSAINTLFLTGASSISSIKDILGINSVAGRMMSGMSEKELAAMIKPRSGSVAGQIAKGFKDATLHAVPMTTAMTGASMINEKMEGREIHFDEHLVKTTVDTILFGIAGGATRSLSAKSGLEQSNILSNRALTFAGLEPKKFIAEIESRVQNGQMNPRDAEIVKGKIEEMHQKIKNTIYETESGDRMSDDAVVAYTNNVLRIEDLSGELKKDIPQSMREKMERELQMLKLENIDLRKGERPTIYDIDGEKVDVDTFKLAMKDGSLATKQWHVENSPLTEEAVEKFNGKYDEETKTGTNEATVSKNVTTKQAEDNGTAVQGSDTKSTTIPTGTGEPKSIEAKKGTPEEISKPIELSTEDTSKPKPTSTTVIMPEKETDIKLPTITVGGNEKGVAEVEKPSIHVEMPTKEDAQLEESGVEKEPLPIETEETANQKLIQANKEHEKAKAELKKAEDSIASKQGQQSSMFDATQKDLFAIGGEEAKTILDPLKNKVKETKQAVEDAQKVVDNLPKKGEQSLFEQKAEPTQKTETKKQEFVTKSGNQKVTFVEGDLEVKNIDGTDVSDATKRKALQEYADNYDYTVGETSTTMPADIKTEKDYNRHIIETSNNPAEIAAVYATQEQETVALSEKESVIARMGVGKVTKESIERFGDGNHITAGIALNYIGKKSTGKKIATIDQVAKEMSDHSGLDITPQDVWDYMVRHNGRNAERLFETSTALDAVSKFKELTGINLTKEVAQKAIEQEYKKLSLQEQGFVEKDFETLKQLENEYWEQYAKTDGFTKESSVGDIEKTETASMGERKNEKQEPKVEKPFNKDKFKKIADIVRKGMIEDDIMMSNVPFAKEIWNGAVETFAKTIEITGDAAEALSKAIAHIKQSDWYKNLSDDNKKRAEARFKQDYEDFKAGTHTTYFEHHKKALKEEYGFEKAFEKRGHAEVGTEVFEGIQQRSKVNGNTFETQLQTEALNTQVKKGVVDEKDIVTVAMHVQALTKGIEKAREDGNQNRVATLEMEREAMLMKLRELGNNAGRNLYLFRMAIELDIANESIRTTIKNINNSLGVKEVFTTVTALNKSNLPKEIKDILEPFVDKIEKLTKAHKKSVEDFEKSQKQSLEDLGNQKLQEFSDQDNDTESNIKYITDLEAKVKDLETKLNAASKGGSDAAAKELVNAQKAKLSIEAKKEKVLSSLKNLSNTLKTKGKIDGTDVKVQGFDIQNKLAEIVDYIIDKVENGELDKVFTAAEAFSSAVSNFGKGNENKFRQELLKELEDNGIDTSDYIDKKDAKESILEALRGGNLREAKSYLQAMVKEYIEQGMTDHNEIIAAMHKELNGAELGFTERELRDATTGYGITKEYKGDPLYGEIMSLLQLTSKVDDAKNSKSPTKMMTTRAITEKEMAMSKELRHFMRENGLLDLQGEKQIKGVIDAMRTRLNNRLRELNSAIDNNTKLVKRANKVTDLPDDIKALKDAIKIVEDEYNTKFGLKKVPRTAEEKRLASIEKDIDNILKGITKKKRIKFEDTEAVKKLIAERDRIKADLGITNPKKMDVSTPKDPIEQKIDSLEKELENLLQGNYDKYTVDKKNGKMSNPVIDDLLDRIYNEKVNAGLIKSKVISPQEKLQMLADAKIKAVENEIAKLENKILNKKFYKPTEIDFNDFEATELNKLIEQRDLLKSEFDVQKRENAFNEISKIADEKGVTSITYDMAKDGLIADMVENELRNGTKPERVYSAIVEKLQDVLPDVNRTQVIEAYTRKGEFAAENEKTVKTAIQELEDEVARLGGKETRLDALEAANSWHEIADKKEKKDYASEFEKDLQEKIAERTRALKESDRADEILAEIEHLKKTGELFWKEIKMNNKKKTAERLLEAREKFEQALMESGKMVQKQDKKPIQITIDYDKAVKAIENDKTLSDEEKTQQIEGLTIEKNKLLEKTYQLAINNAAENLTSFKETLSESLKEKIDGILKHLKPEGTKYEQAINIADAKILDLLESKLLDKQQKNALRDIHRQLKNENQLSFNRIQKENTARLLKNKIKNNQKKLNSGVATFIEKDAYDLQTERELAAMEFENMKLENGLKSLAFEARNKRKGIADAITDLRTQLLISGIGTVERVAFASVLKPIGKTLLDITSGRLTAAMLDVPSITKKGLRESLKFFSMPKNAEQVAKDLVKLEAKTSESIKALENARKTGDIAQIKQAEIDFKEAHLNEMIGNMYKFLEPSTISQGWNYLNKASMKLDELMGKGVLNEGIVKEFKAKANSAAKIGYMLETWVSLHGALKGSVSSRASFKRGWADSLAYMQKRDGELNEANITESMMYAYEAYEEGRYQTKNQLSTWVNQQKNVDNVVGRTLAKVLFPVSTIPVNIAKAGIDYTPIGVGEALYRLATSTKKQMRLSEAEGRQYDSFFKNIKDNIKRVPMKERVYISKVLSRGMLGTALGAFVWWGLHSGNIKYGGNYDDNREGLKVIGSNGKPLEHGEWEFFGVRSTIHKKDGTKNTFYTKLLHHLPITFGMGVVANYYTIKELDNTYEYDKKGFVKLDSRLEPKTKADRLGYYESFTNELWDRLIFRDASAILSGHLEKFGSSLASTGIIKETADKFDKDAEKRDNYKNFGTMVRKSAGLGFMNPIKNRIQLSNEKPDEEKTESEKRRDKLLNKIERIKEQRRLGRFYKGDK